MTDLPIRPEALEAATDAYDVASREAPLPHGIEAALAEFCRAEGLMVETRGERPEGRHFPPKQRQRLVGKWREVER